MWSLHSALTWSIISMTWLVLLAHWRGAAGRVIKAGIEKISHLLTHNVWGWSNKQNRCYVWSSFSVATNIKAKTASKARPTRLCWHRFLVFSDVYDTLSFWCREPCLNAATVIIIKLLHVQLGTQVRGHKVSRLLRFFFSLPLPYCPRGVASRLVPSFKQTAHCFLSSARCVFWSAQLQMGKAPAQGQH